MPAQRSLADDLRGHFPEPRLLVTNSDEWELVMLPLLVQGLGGLQVIDRFQVIPCGARTTPTMLLAQQQSPSSRPEGKGDT